MAMAMAGAAETTCAAVRGGMCVQRDFAALLTLVLPLSMRPGHSAIIIDSAMVVITGGSAAALVAVVLCRRGGCGRAAVTRRPRRVIPQPLPA